MTATIAATLFILAILDGAFAGFRSSAGRTGLINHRQSDYQAARRGTVLALVMLAPVIAATSVDVLIHPVHRGDYTRAGTVMLAVYGPYALLVLIALACYSILGWRLKYLAAALILGPFTLLRPGIAVLGAALATALSNNLVVAILAGLSVVAVLAVEPLADRLWYAVRLVADREAGGVVEFVRRGADEHGVTLLLSGRRSAPDPPGSRLQ